MMFLLIPVFLAAQTFTLIFGGVGFTICIGTPGAPVLSGACPTTPTPTPTPRPSPTVAPTAVPTAVPTVAPTAVPTGIPTAVPTVAPTAVPTAVPTGVAQVKSDVNAYSILAPAAPIPETTPAPLCIIGSQYVYALGDDFTQETQAQFQRYTTQWEINQYRYNNATTNWMWSDQYSGIGRRNDFGAGDTYMVHIDDSNPQNSYPASWVNSVFPRPGNQIIGTPPNAYLDIRAVAIPAQYLADPSINGAHWLTGGLQGAGFTFGYTEALIQMPAPASGVWPALWTLNVPGGGGWDGTGTNKAGNYIETDIFERFGTTLGNDTIQMTMNSGRPDAQFVRPTTPGSSTSYHTYGSLWVPPILGNPAYIVFYIDRLPVSYYLTTAPIGNVNPNINLQMGTQSGSFVGPADLTTTADMKVKNYFTWQPNGQPCNTISQANPIPTPAPTASPQPAPPVASNIVPKLLPYAAQPVIGKSQVEVLPSLPSNGDLIIIQGISGTAFCPTGFTFTGGGDAYLCTGIVGANGLIAAIRYNIGGAGFDKSAIMDVGSVTSYTINTDVSSGWHSENPAVISKSQTVTTANALELAFGWNISDAPRYTTASSYTSNLPFNTIYQSNGDSSYGRGIAMLETNVDPFTAPGGSVSFTGSYAWTGTPSTNGNNVFPFLVTITVH